MKFNEREMSLATGFELMAFRLAQPCQNSIIVEQLWHITLQDVSFSKKTFNESISDDLKCSLFENPTNKKEKPKSWAQQKIVEVGLKQNLKQSHSRQIRALSKSFFQLSSKGLRRRQHPGVLGLRRGRKVNNPNPDSSLNDVLND